MPDLKELLDSALPDAWEATASPADAAIKRGTRMRRRRRAMSTVAGLGSFVVLVLLASSMIGGPRPDDTPPAGSRTTVKLPTLESGEHYYWEEDRETYDEKPELLKPYDKALKSFLAEDDSTLLNPGDSVRFERIGRQLVHDEGGDYLASTAGDAVVHRQPGYYATFNSPEGESGYVDIVPSGGFTAGSTRDISWESGGEYMGSGNTATHLVACGEYADGVGTDTFADITAECEYTTGPDGQDVIRAIETRTTTAGDTYYYGRLVLYREDGTAIRVRFNSDRDDSEVPALLDEMTALAAALPSEPVR